MDTRSLLSIASIVIVMACPVITVAQQIGIQTPAVSVGDSYYENFGVNFGFQFGGPNSQTRGFFQQGSAGSAIPPFGGYDPAADARFGFSGRSGNGSYSLGLTMGKGSSRTLTGASPSVVVPNGGIGSFFSGSSRPFVTGVIPVVGFRSQPTLPPGTVPVYEPRFPSYPYAQYLAQRSIERANAPEERTSGAIQRSAKDSTALQGDLSVAEIKRQRAAQLASNAIKQLAELDAYISAAENAEKEGKIQSARLNYRRAVRIATGRQKYELQIKLDELVAASKKNKND